MYPNRNSELIRNGLIDLQERNFYFVDGANAPIFSLSVDPIHTERPGVLDDSYRGMSLVGYLTEITRPKRLSLRTKIGEYALAASMYPHNFLGNPLTGDVLSSIGLAMGSAPIHDSLQRYMRDSLSAPMPPRAADDAPTPVYDALRLEPTAE